MIDRIFDITIKFLGWNGFNSIIEFLFVLAISLVLLIMSKPCKILVFFVSIPLDDIVDL